MDLYRVKPALLRGLDPVLGRLERAGVPPDVLTLAAVPVGAVAGAAILVSPSAPWVLIVVPLAEKYLSLLQLSDKRNKIARGLSGGMKRRLMIARALVHEPRDRKSVV